MMTHIFCISNLNRGQHILRNTSVLKPSELFCCLLPTQVTNLKKRSILTEIEPHKWVIKNTQQLFASQKYKWNRTQLFYAYHIAKLIVQDPNNHKNTVCKCSVFANYSTMFYQYCLVLNQMQMHLYLFLQRAHHSAFWDCILHEGRQQKNLIKLLPTFSLHLRLCCCCYY